MRNVFIAFFLIMAFVQSAWATNCPSLLPEPTGRYLVVVSDLHFGVGMKNGAWNPTEDFRWSKALSEFLKRISECGKDAVDLVIAGDSMELWQPPPAIKCLGVNPDTGCTRDESLAVAKIVTSAHEKDFSAFGAFSNNGTNRVFFLPGNHDATLLLDEIWAEVLRAVNSKSGRVFRCGPNAESPCTRDAMWVSGDGQVVIEHGHQIGSDVNKFSHWPSILVNVKGADYVERPWGQWFVQSLFNAEEQNYSIIDNLIPESAGARFRMADRGIVESAADLARFLRFNLVETSLSQKLKALGPPSPSRQWNLDKARSLGYKLYAQALPEQDQFRLVLVGNTPRAIELQKILNNLLADKGQVPDAEVKLLCDQMAIRSKGVANCDGTLGAVAESILFSKNDIVASHLSARMEHDGLKKMRVFIYAHTHQLEEEWAVKTESGINAIKVYNTGAFQRLVDEEGFLKRAGKMSPGEALRKLQVEDLPPCYTAVVVALGIYPIQARTVRWYMAETELGTFVSPDDDACK